MSVDINSQEPKTASQLWRESGTSLSFKDWVVRAKKDGLFMKNAVLSKILDEESTNLGVVPTTIEDKSKIFGLNKRVLAICGLILITAISVKLYHKNHG